MTDAWAGHRRASRGPGADLARLKLATGRRGFGILGLAWESESPLRISLSYSP